MKGSVSIVPTTVGTDIVWGGCGCGCGTWVRLCGAGAVRGYACAVRVRYMGTVLRCGCGAWVRFCGAGAVHGYGAWVQLCGAGSVCGHERVPVAVAYAVCSAWYVLLVGFGGLI